MRVLMLAYHYPPMNNGGVQRSRVLAAHFRSLGWPLNIFSTRLAGLSDDPDVTQIHDLISLVRRGKPVAGGGRAGASRASGSLKSRLIDIIYGRLLVPDRELVWAWLALWPALKAARRAEVIYSTSPPHSVHLLARWLKRFSGKPWVMDLRDPWSLEPIASYSHLPGRLKREARQERLCIADADAVILNTPQAAEAYRTLYPEHAAKMHAIPNGFDAELLEHARQTVDDAAVVQTLPEGAFVLSHAGLFARAADGQPIPAALLEALTALRAAGDLPPPDRFRVVLAGALPAQAANLIADAGLSDWVTLPGLIAQVDALRLMQRSDLLLMADPPDGGALYVRGKLYEYLGSGKPILALLPAFSASRALIEQGGAGLVIDAGDSMGLAQALRQFLHGDVNLTPADPAQFAYDRRAAQVAAVIEGVAAPG
jgi:glycosyltransferase involved in cell wall biosynthesis